MKGGAENNWISHFLFAQWIQTWQMLKKLTPGAVHIDEQTIQNHEFLSELTK